MQFCNICAASQKMFCFWNLFQAVHSECPPTLRLIVIRIQEFLFPVSTRAKWQRRTGLQAVVYSEIRQSGKRGFLTTPADLSTFPVHLWLASLQDSEPRLSINSKFDLSPLAMWWALSLRFVVLMFLSVSLVLFLHYCPFLYRRSLLPPKAFESWILATIAPRLHLS